VLVPSALRTPAPRDHDLEYVNGTRMKGCTYEVFRCIKGPFGSPHDPAWLVYSETCSVESGCGYTI
jgi:hypothetical protein